MKPLLSSKIHKKGPTISMTWVFPELLPWHLSVCGIGPWTALRAPTMLSLHRTNNSSNGTKGTIFFSVCLQSQTQDLSIVLYFLTVVLVRASLRLLPPPSPPWKTVLLSYEPKLIPSFLKWLIIKQGTNTEANTYEGRGKTPIPILPLVEQEEKVIEMSYLGLSSQPSFILSSMTSYESL